MAPLLHKPTFTEDQLQTVNNAVAMSEELVSNHYKMSASQWLRPKYDVKTLVELNANEIVEGPFAQVVRYVGKRQNSLLGSEAYDFYKICLQDHAILGALQQNDQLQLLPFVLYIVTHELVHIVRFSKFLQSFDASAEEKLTEEARVHRETQVIVGKVQLNGIQLVLDFYSTWQLPIENLQDPIP
ncbi:MAG: hypothetical protein QNJ22_19060 [Desulfosarcinaceae bacterium]|nr:hypothetical protein [Desulfosarcinaceae bacterium]